MEKLKKWLGIAVVATLIGGWYYWITRPMPVLEIRGQTPMMKHKRAYADLSHHDRDEEVEVWIPGDAKVEITDYGFTTSSNEDNPIQYLWLEARWMGYSGYLFDDDYTDVTWPNGRRW